MVSAVNQAELEATTGAAVHHIECDRDVMFDLLLAHPLELPFSRPSHSWRGRWRAHWSWLVHFDFCSKFAVQLLLMT